MEIHSNVLVENLELDLIAVENASSRPLIYVIEVKSRPKHKLLYQLLSRVGISDYIYAALPIRHYSYLFEIPEPAGSLAVDIDNEVVYEIKRPTYIGNGWKLLEALRSRPLQCNQQGQTGSLSLPTPGERTYPGSPPRSGVSMPRDPLGSVGYTVEAGASILTICKQS